MSHRRSPLQRLPGVALAVLVAASLHARASVPSLTECLEGSDFIANAARARDNGITQGAFMEQLESDFVTIRAFPAELRWFVKDPDDERFLADEARQVFDVPSAPSVHRAGFLRACLERLGG